MKKLRIIHFHRRPRPNVSYSIEGFYANVRNVLSDKITIQYVELPFYSNGVFRRLFNCIYAAFKQGDVNHVTGDVNYLNIFFNKNKTIVTILDCGLLESKKGFAHKVYKYFWYTLPIKRAKYIVAISEATKTEILKYIDCEPDKIKVIHVSVSPILHYAEKVFNKEKPVILHVGTTANKNLHGLIEAVKGINCKLVIIGGLNENNLKQLNDYKIGPQVCYESLFPDFSKGLSDIGAQFIVNATNDSWYGTWQEPYQHLYMTLARAVEFRRPVVRVTNTGISTVALASGKVLHRSPLNQEWSGLYTVPYSKDPASTFYQRNFWMMPCLLMAIFVVLFIAGVVARLKSND